jgi:hypothetical protein
MPSSDTDCSSASQKNPKILWKPNANYRFKNTVKISMIKKFQILPIPCVLHLNFFYFYILSYHIPFHAFFAVLYS